MSNLSENELYLARAEEMDEEYLAAWAAMPEEMRRKFAERGIAGPELNDYETKQGSVDVSDFVELATPEVSESWLRSLAQDFTEMCGQFDVPPAVIQRLFYLLVPRLETEANRRGAQLMGRTVGLLLAEANVKVSVMGLAFAMDFPELHRMGLTSMRKAAPYVGCTPSYLSQHANKWCDVLGLPRPKSMKSQEARETYREERKSNHWRTQKC